MQKDKETCVKIVLADIRSFSGRTDEMKALAAPCYVKKYEDYSYKEEAGQELVSGYLLQKYLGISCDKQLRYNAYNKPFLASGEVYFNLSHSGNYAALAIADCNLGLDIEKIRMCHGPTANKYFTSKEKEELFQQKGVAKDEGFTKLWTRHEAILKWKGTGLMEEERFPEEECRLYTIKVNEYYISCAVDREATLIIENIESPDF